MIRNIIFDFGGVLLNLDFKKSFDAFEALGFNNFDEMYTQHAADELFQSLETGKISPDAFYKKLNEVAPKPVTDQQLTTAWNAMLVDYRKESLDFLTSLKSKYNLYLLSNTNEIHYNAFSKMLSEKTSYKSLESFFVKAYYSHRVHLRKPDIEIFEFVLNDAGITAEETLFIDDSFSNFPNAEKLGIKTHLLLPEESIEFIDYNIF